MAHAFISYSRNDEQIADEIEQRLIAYDLNPYRDTSNIRSGREWTIQIDRAVEDSYAMIVICTTHSKTRANVVYEWAYARGLKYVSIIPVYIKDPADEIPAQLLDTQMQALQYNAFGFWTTLVNDLREIRNRAEIETIFIPLEADKYHRDLAFRAYQMTYYEENEDAISMLFTTDSDVARQIIINGLNHRQQKIQRYIVNSMSSTGFSDVRAVPKLKDLFFDQEQSPDMRQAVSHALSHMGAATVEALVPEIQFIDGQQLVLLLTTIVQTEEIRAIPYFVQELTLDNPLRAQTVLESLAYRPLSEAYRKAVAEATVPQVQQIMKHIREHGKNASTQPLYDTCAVYLRAAKQVWPID